MIKKRITIYDIANALDISAPYVSRALSDDPLINPKLKETVLAKAKELNYKQNVNASNLRKGITRTIGVIVPLINEIFFANAIAGIEEACSENNYNLIICQSGESFEKEAKAIDTLIQQNVDCILISITKETNSSDHLQEIINNKIHLIQFDRVRQEVESFKIENDNFRGAYIAGKHLIEKGYRKIALIGGPLFLKIYHDRKSGFESAMEEYGISVPEHFVIDGGLNKTFGFNSAVDLLSGTNKPDAIFCSSDSLALGVLQAAASLNIKVPQELGVIGFQNEPFGELIMPSLSTIDQNSKELGKHAANVYFKFLLKKNSSPITELIPCSLIERNSTNKDKANFFENEAVSESKNGITRFT